MITRSVDCTQHTRGRPADQLDRNALWQARTAQLSPEQNMALCAAKRALAEVTYVSAGQIAAALTPSDLEHFEREYRTPLKFLLSTSLLAALVAKGALVLSPHRRGRDKLYGLPLPGGVVPETPAASTIKPRSLVLQAFRECWCVNRPLEGLTGADLYEFSVTHPAYSALSQAQITLHLNSLKKTGDLVVAGKRPGKGRYGGQNLFALPIDSAGRSFDTLSPCPTP